MCVSFLHFLSFFPAQSPLLDRLFQATQQEGGPYAPGPAKGFFLFKGNFHCCLTLAFCNAPEKILTITEALYQNLN